MRQICPDAEKTAYPLRCINIPAPQFPRGPRTIRISISLLAKYGLTCRVWWDVEDRALTGLGPGVLTGLIRSARNTVEGAGLEFGIYTGLAFYEAGYFDVSAFGCPYWIARYPSSAYFDFGQAPPPESGRPQISQRLAAWQYTGKGRIAGIAGNVDLNVCYLPFGEKAEESRPGEG